MGLREALQKSVASCATKQTQHATSTADSATADATTAQQIPANPHGIMVSCATGSATAAQQGQKDSATQADSEQKLRVAFASTRNTQHGALTAHRLANELIAAAMKRCDEFNDNEAARAEMRRDCLELPPRLQADLLSHFTGKPATFD